MRRGALLMAVIAVCASGAAESGATRVDLVVPGVGAVALAYPADWQCQVTGPGESPTLTCAHDKPNGFRVLVTAMAGKTMTDSQLKTSVQGAGEALLPGAMQKELTLRRVAGAEATGYVYALTDKSPEKGPRDFREMTQGIILLRQVALSATILTQTGGSRTVDAALAMLSAASAAAAPPSAAAEGPDTAAPDHLAIRETATAYELTVPVSRLMMTLPKSDFAQKKETTGAASDSPRYFYFRAKSTDLILSGWFESADGFSGINKFWAGETAGWKRTGIPAPTNVSFDNIGRWQVILYDIELPGAKGANPHIRAEWIEAGTWIDIHLSLTTDQPLAEARRTLRSVLESIEVKEREQ
jgi:hypothetical protein